MMNYLSLSQISAAVDAAYATALAQSPAVRVPVQAIGDNATLSTDLYSGPGGTGFVVQAKVDLKFRALTVARQHGPETWREQPVPSLASLETECQQARAKRYAAEASVYDLADAETKLSSQNLALQAEGAVQKAAVLARRLEIKSNLPKPL